MINDDAELRGTREKEMCNDSVARAPAFRRTRTIIAAALTFGTIASGWYTGIEVYHPGRPPTLYTTGACLAVGVLLIGAAVSIVSKHSTENPGNPLVCCGLVPYALVTIFFEPFLSVHLAEEIVLAVAFLVPGLIAIFLLVHRQEWVSLTGLLLFLLVGFAMLSTNIRVWDAGSGFFSSWIS